MSIWEAFGMGRHKGFSREAGLLLDEAVELAGSMGCARADTGHLLLAMLQTGRGTAVEFLRRKQITVTALSACASQRACTGRPLHLRGRDLAPESRKALPSGLFLWLAAKNIGFIGFIAFFNLAFRRICCMIKKYALF